MLDTENLDIKNQIIDPTKPCKACSEPIKATAKKCPNCSSFQNWQRHINFGSNIISLIIALISVTALSIGHIHSAFEKEYSDLRIALLTTSKGGVSLLAVNDGNRSAAMIFGELEVYDSRYGVANYDMQPVDGSLIVGPGKAKEVKLVFSDPENTQQRHRDRVQEGIKENNWKKEEGFITESNIQVWIVQHSEFVKVFDAQQKKTSPENTKLTKFSDSASRAIKSPDRQTVELELSPYDIFPWLINDWALSIELKPNEPE